MRRHHLQDESEGQENSRAPPRRFGEDRSRLPHSDEGIGRRAGPAEVCGKPASLAGLQQDRGNENDRINYENDEEKSVEHEIRRESWVQLCNISCPAWWRVNRAKLSCQTRQARCGPAAAGRPATSQSQTQNSYARVMASHVPGSRLAPPTRRPLTPGAASSEAALPGLTLPP